MPDAIRRDRRGALASALVVLAILASVFASAAQAADVTVYAQVDRKHIGLRQPFAYTIYAEGTRSNPDVQLPGLKDAGFEILRGPNLGTNMTSVNGEVQISVNATYYLRPTKSGSLQIPAATVVVDGKSYATEAIPIDVSDKPASDAPDVSDTLVPEVTVGDTDPVVGECIDVVQRIRVASRVRFRGNLSADPLSATGFVEKPIDKEWQNHVERKGGETFTVYERHSVMIPIREGDATLGPLVVKGEALVRRRGRPSDPFFGESMFDDFTADAIPVQSESKPIAIHVHPLPAEGRPADFKGAVGDFAMKASVSPATVAAGDPVTLTVVLSGKGDVESLPMPALSAIPDTRAYDPDRKVQLIENATTLGGSVTYTQAIVPASPGKLVIPALSFAFFDPGAAPPRYRTVSAGPFEVEVTPGAKSTGGLVTATPGGERPTGEIAILGKDLLPLRTTASPFVAIGSSGDLDGGAIALLAGAPAIFLVALVVRRRTDRLRADPAFARSLRAAKVARDRFDELRREGAAIPDLPGEASRALTTYLGDKLGVPAPSFIGGGAGAKLREKAIPDALAGEIVECLDACDRARYGGASAGGAILLDAAEKLVDSVEKSLR
jgi:oxygen tolerance protein BatD